MTEKDSYWKTYRNISANVQEHISQIYRSSETCSSSENDTADHEYVGETNETETACAVRSPTISLIRNRSNPSQNLFDESCFVENQCSLSSESYSQETTTDEDNFDSCNYYSSSSDTDSDDSYDLVDDLCAWVSKYNISINATHSLLSLLRPHHPFLPKDPRTLLKTKKHYDVARMNGGTYYHFGVGVGILQELKTNSCILIADIHNVLLQINIDGLPLFKSSSTQFWPILGKLSHPYSSKPFIIGLFLGDQKPGNVEEFLQNFLDEMQVLQRTGIQVPNTDQYIGVEISCVICDTPAKSFVKQVTGHTGYYGCDKCCQRGVWKGKLTFHQTDAPLRTDIQFDEMTNEEHHRGVSPFQVFGLGMVSQFTIDYMHLVCLGVMKRLLFLWMKGTFQCRQGVGFSVRVNENLGNVRGYLPREFLRKGRSLFQVDRWKATEFRQFLLYTGPVVLKNSLPRHFYDQFLLLFVSIYCLSSPFFFNAYCDYANQLLHVFVNEFGRLYGEDQYVYNVHGLVHLAQDVSKYGVLDNFSAFPFESFLGKLKRLVRKPNFPLQQVIRRFTEGKILSSSEEKIPNCGIAKKQHRHGPIDRAHQGFSQFEELHLPNIYLALTNGDNCIIIGEKVGLVRNILSEGADLDKLLLVEWFSNIRSFFTSPLESSDLRIFRVGMLNNSVTSIKVSDVTCKCVLLPQDDYFVAVPLIHDFM